VLRRGQSFLGLLSRELGFDCVLLNDVKRRFFSLLSWLHSWKYTLSSKSEVSHNYISSVQSGFIWMCYLRQKGMGSHEQHHSRLQQWWLLGTHFHVPQFHISELVLCIALVSVKQCVNLGSYMCRSLMVARWWRLLSAQSHQAAVPSRVCVCSAISECFGIVHVCDFTCLCVSSTNAFTSGWN